MSTPTVPVTVTLAAQDGTPYEGVVVRARLDGNEVYEGIVISDQVEETTDADGVAILNLFPNAPSPTGLGTQGTTYRFFASIPGGRGLNVDARVPNSACRLENILVTDDVGDLSAAELAVLQAQAAVTTAASSAAAAEEDANQTAADRVQTGLDRTATATSETNAAASASAAATSETNAAASAAQADAARDDVDALAGFRDFQNLTVLLANSTLTYTAAQDGTVAAGDIIRTRKEGFAFEVAASGASNHDTSTAGGVKLYYRTGGLNQDGKKYRFMAFCLRQDTAGSGWYALDNTSHAPVGIDSVSATAVAGKITVTFDRTFGKVVSFIAAPDEALAKLGFSCGASVDTDEARIELAAPLEFTVEFDGTANPPITCEPYWSLVDATVSLTTGSVTLAHETILSDEVEPVIQMLDGTDFLAGSVQHSSRSSFIAYVEGPICTRVRYDGAAWTHDDTGMSLSLFYNTTNGIAVQYGSDPNVDALWGAQVSAYGDSSLLPYVKAQAAGSVSVKFRDFAGTVITAVATTMDFNLFVPGRFRRKVPQGKMYVRRGLARVDPVNLGASFLDQNTTNIWCFGVFEE